QQRRPANPQRLGARADGHGRKEHQPQMPGRLKQEEAQQDSSWFAFGLGCLKEEPACYREHEYAKRETAGNVHNQAVTSPRRTLEPAVSSPLARRKLAHD